MAIACASPDSRTTRIEATPRAPRPASPTPRPASPAATLPPDDTLSFGPFGTVRLLRDADRPSHVLVFLSGDGGWDRTARRLARQLAAVDALVVGVDDRVYMRRLLRGPGSCAYPAGDLEALSQYVQKRLDRARYEPPVLVGHSSGAAIVYAALVQAPPNTFQGAISLGFCPALPGTKPFCRVPSAAGGTPSAAAPEVPPRRRTAAELRLAPGARLSAPWAVLAGLRDEECGADSAGTFARRTSPPATVVTLPGVGHGFSDSDAWLPAFRQVYAAMVAATDRSAASGAAAPAVRDLPLVEVRSPNENGETLAVVLSGDGGWASIDREIAERFAERGVSTVGLNSLEYFWHGSSPDSSARDLARVLRHYLAAWGKERLLLVGYSLGADVLPFMATRLPPDLRARVRLVALVSPGRTAAFEFHLTDWLGGGDRRGHSLPTAPEIARLRGTPLLCVYGTEEDDSVCPTLDPTLATRLALRGGHHLGGDYRRIAESILSAAR